ncbi:MAG: hypothetical protein HY865_02480 [Chloroflexi bacterium]|nr:hypothetical protein [Chloroflexota bacterium]
MSVKYSVVERGKPGSPETPKKFYPSVQSSGRVITREVAEMAAIEFTKAPDPPAAPRAIDQ